MLTWHLKQRSGQVGASIVWYLEEGRENRQCKGLEEDRKKRV